MTQQIRYDLIQKNNDIEIRRYPEVLFAVVEGFIDDSGFSLLFQYINGENTTKQKIKMTAPVFSRNEYMAIALPPSFTQENSPVPINPAVKIRPQPKKAIAILRFSGRTPEHRVEKYIQKLHTTLQNQGKKTTGEPILMRYNNPLTPGFLRRNEVGIEIILTK